MSRINIMASRHSPFYSPLIACIAGGFLEEERLEPSYAVATPDATVPDGLRVAPYSWASLRCLRHSRRRGRGRGLRQRCLAGHCSHEHPSYRHSDEALAACHGCC